MESPSALLNTNSEKKTALKKLKFSVTFRETELSYIFFKKFVLYFRKWNFLALAIKNFRRELSKLEKFCYIRLLFRLSSSKKLNRTFCTLNK